MLLFFAALALAFWLTMVVAWIFQRRVRNAGWIDVFWTFATGATGFAAALYPVAGQPWPTARQLLVAALVAAWSLRLGLHMAHRVARNPEDLRYAVLRQQWGEDFQRRFFWFVQNEGIGSIVLSLSILAAAQNPATGLRLADFAGAALMVAAIAGEGLADRQLSRFKTDPHNAGGICDVGLWSWSRHPNYFFEWLGWFAYPLIAIDLTGAYPWGWVAFAAPALMYWVLNYHTGLPYLEAHMARSRGEAWRSYRARTNAFVPWPPIGR